MSEKPKMTKKDIREDRECRKEISQLLMDAAKLIKRNKFDVKRMRIAVLSKTSQGIYGKGDFTTKDNSLHLYLKVKE